MIARVIEISDLRKSNRWRVEPFMGEAEATFEERQTLIAVSDLCEEVSEAIDPLHSSDKSFVYVGMENVESITGDLHGEVIKEKGAVRSRSKIFKMGDVLYGRLRPNLRKVFAAIDLAGLCSTEFIVLRPKKEVSAEVLRAILASSWVSERLSNLQIGAALPRVSARDLMAMRIPFPDSKKRKKIESKLENLKSMRIEAKRIIAKSAAEIEAAVRS